MNPESLFVYLPTYEEVEEPVQEVEEVPNNENAKLLEEIIEETLARKPCPFCGRFH